MAETKITVEATMISRLSGASNAMSIEVYKSDWDHWNNTPKSQRKFVQDCFPYLTADEREFLITGITKAEWDKAHGN